MIVIYVLLFIYDYVIYVIYFTGYSLLHVHCPQRSVCHCQLNHHVHPLHYERRAATKVFRRNEVSSIVSTLLSIIIYINVILHYFIIYFVLISLVVSLPHSLILCALIPGRYAIIVLIEWVWVNTLYLIAYT